MDDLDARVRLAAFRFLEGQLRLGGQDTSIRRDVLQRGFTFEGHRVPMLIHGLQGFHGARLLVPRREAWRPDRRLLEERYALFRPAAG